MEKTDNVQQKALKRVNLLQKVKNIFLSSKMLRESKHAR